MRILVVTSTFPRWPGDATTLFVLHFAQALKAHGVDVDVLAPHAPGARTAEELEGVHVERFRYFVPESGQDVCYGGGALFNLRGSTLRAAKLPVLVGAETGAIRRRLRGDRYDVVSAHWLLPQGWAAVRASGRSTPVVTTIHGSDVFGLGHPMITRFKRIALHGAAAVTVNSSATRDAVEQLVPDLPDVRTIPMGVDVTARPTEEALTRWSQRREGNAPLVAYVGRLIDWKGVDDLLEAVSLLRPEQPDLRLVVAGTGPLESHLRLRASSLSIDDMVAFTGWLDRSDVLALQAAADVVVAPSRASRDGSREAQGLSVIEAMALGKPVVAGNVGGIPDAIDDDVSGLLVPERDPAALANAIRRVCVDRSLAGRLGAAAQEKAAGYEWPAVSARFVKTFEAALSRGRVK